MSCMNDDSCPNKCMARHEWNRCKKESCKLGCLYGASVEIRFPEITGDQDETGDTGPSGGDEEESGNSGNSGASGDSGNSGSSGTTGPSGGDEEESGNSGSSGASGESGNSGSSGTTGPSGGDEESGTMCLLFAKLKYKPDKSQHSKWRTLEENCKKVMAQKQEEKWKSSFRRMHSEQLRGN